MQKGMIGKAGGFLLAFLGIGFLASMVDRFIGWNAEDSGWKSGVITLGATLLAYVGLKAFKQGKWANTAAVAGLSFAGVQAVANPVNNAGAKLADWLRGGGNTTPRMSQQPSGGNNQPQDSSYNNGAQYDNFSYTPPQSAAPQQQAPAPQQQAPQQQYQQPQQPQTIIYEAQEVDPWVQIAGAGIGALGQVFGSAVGAGGIFGGSAGDRNSRLALASIG